MNFHGLILGVATFLIIGLFHPIVIKTEYYFGTKAWWVFAATGTALLAWSLFSADALASSLLAVTGVSCLWSIIELFEQEKRVRRGWFPANPKRR